MTPFIPDKITSPAELPRVSRGRLISTLRESLADCNSTIVQGRAGAGKTLLAADFARRCKRAVAWYTVDAPDAELSSFFRYLCAAVAAKRPGFGHKTLEHVGGHVGADDVPLLVEYFVYELLESSDSLLVVIDDLHLVYDAGWMVPLFRRLLPLLPREVHVCLIGRSLPPTPLWRMRSKQTLCIVDEPALAFTLQETRRLYAGYGLPVERAEAALRATRGRAATLDRRAKFEAAEEGARLVNTRGNTRQGGNTHQSGRLRLVNNFGKSSPGMA